MRRWRRLPAEAGGSRLFIQYLKASPRVCCAEIGALQGKAISPPRTRVGEGGSDQEAPAGPEAGAGVRLTGPSAAGLPPWARARLQDGRAPRRGSPGGGCIRSSSGVSCNPVRFTARETVGSCSPCCLGPRWPERPQLLARDAGKCPGEGRVERPRADPVTGTSSGEPAGRGSQQRPSDQFLSPWLPCSCGGGEGQGERGLLG